jgi:mono/diheme cytochrome c family protein
MKGSILLVILALAFSIGTALSDTGDRSDSAAAVAEKDSISKELDLKVQKIFDRSCATSGCHSGKNPKAGLSLEGEAVFADMAGVKSGQNAEMLLIDPENPSRSYLILKITGGEGMKGQKMPIMKKPLTDEELSALKDWVAQPAPAPLAAPTLNAIKPGEKPSKDPED